MEPDEERALDDLTALLPPLLQALDSLLVVSRHYHPPELASLLAAIGRPDDELRAARAALRDWPERLIGLRARMVAVADGALAAFEGLRAAEGREDGAIAAFRALRALPRALESLYPLAAGLPPVSRFFLDPERRGDEALLARLAAAPSSARAGVRHFGDPPSQPGGFSLYVPEYYAPEREWPVVFALHGGSGNGAAFLWSWLATARGRGAIVVAPTALGDAERRTWALAGPDRDTPNLKRILSFVRENWTIDPARVLLTGMSDGGTFSYVSGLEADSPFTHLAPASAAFHPMLASMVEPARMKDLPIFVAHGARDWMFPVEMARQAAEALKAAGAAVRYREIADLSHTYPREINGEILDWMGVS